MTNELFDISSGHKDLKEDEVRYFGEWVYYDNQEDLDDAYKYLALWKKFHLKRLPEMQQEGNDQIVLRPICEHQATATLGIKIAMKKRY